jgi:hypothetical protein
LGLSCLLAVARLSGAEAEAATGTLAEADRAYAEGVVAYDLARIDDIDGRTAEAKERLAEARKWLDRADAVLMKLRETDADAAITDLLIAVRLAGRPCCGKPSLWERYGMMKK